MNETVLTILTTWLLYRKTSHLKCTAGPKAYSVCVEGLTFICVQRYFCEGDNNRASPQDYRGGVAMCFSGNDALTEAVAEIVAAVQVCTID